MTGPADVQPPAVTPAEDRPVTPNEDVEPRVVGAPGRTSIGLAGYADRITSEDDDLPFHLTLQVDVSHFLTTRIAVRGGVVGSGALGGDPDDVPTGIGVTALHAFGAGELLLHAAGRWPASTPAPATGPRSPPATAPTAARSSASAAWRRRSRRARRVFVEGGYGLGLTRTEDGATRQRFVARVGVRVKL